MFQFGGVGVLFGRSEHPKASPWRRDWRKIPAFTNATSRQLVQRSK